jgi:hypothetical protein
VANDKVKERKVDDGYKTRMKTEYRGKGKGNNTKEKLDSTNRDLLRPVPLSYPVPRGEGGENRLCIRLACALFERPRVMMCIAP